MAAAAEENTSQDSDGSSSWRSTLSIMFIAQLLSIVGFASVLPFIPFYIREIGVTDENLVPVWAGILGAAAGLTMTIFAPVWGWLSDRHGRKLMVERAMFAGALTTMAMGVVGDVYQLLGLRLLSGVFTGTISASLSLVSAVLPGVHLGFGLGVMQVAVFLGMSLGPWIGGMLADAFGYRWAFIAGGAMLLAAGFLVLMGAQEKFVRPSAASLKRSGTMRALLALPGFVTVMAVIFLFHFSTQIAVPVLPLFIEEVGSLKTGLASTTGLMFAVTGAAASVSAVLIGYLSDRIGYKWVLTVNLLIMGLMWAVHALARSIPQLLVIRVLFGFAAGGNLPTINALLGKLTTKETYGQAYGLMASMTSLGMTLGPLAGGILASYVGFRWPFIAVGLLLSLVAMLVIQGVKKF
ncbi:MAG: MFS transporter [Desulfobacterota bacterium]|nr:MFS transporter [Thermodesulfobacteriota bacterium]